MSTEDLKRTQYWNLDTNSPRASATQRAETFTDWRSYLLPLASMVGSSFHTWGVAEGLTVSATANQVDLTIAPGVGLDAAGHVIALASTGFAITAPNVDPNQMRNVPTVQVEATGVSLTTNPLQGDYFVTIRWREVEEGDETPVLKQTPWLRLLSVAGYQDTGAQLILARVTLDSNSRVTALTPAGRRLVGVPVERIEFRRPRAGTSGLSIDQIASAELRSRSDGGVELNLLPTGDGLSRQPLAIDGATGNLWLAPQTGNVGIGTTPDHKLHVTDGATHLRFGNEADIAVLRVENAKPSSTTALNFGNDRQAWQLRIDGSDGQKLKVYDANAIRDVLTIDTSGNVGIGTTDPAAGRLQFDNGGGNKIVVYDNGPTDRYGFGLNGGNLNAFVPAGGRFSVRLNSYDGTELMTVTGAGNVGVGTTQPENSEGWGRVLDCFGNGHTKLSIRTTAIDARVLAHENGWWGSNPGMVMGTKSAHAVGLATNGATRLTVDPAGNVGVGTAEPKGKLDVQGDIRAGNSDIYFTKTDHVHSGIGNTAGYAAIENASDFDALMILGRTGAGADTRRKVKLWDYLEVNGSLAVQGDLAMGSGKTISSPGRLHISGEENLYLLNKGGVIVSKAWQGNGNLTVEGNLTTNGDLAIGSGKTISSPGRLHIAGEEDLYLLNKGGVIVSKAWGGNGNLTVEGNLTMSSGTTISCPGRLHIAGEELLYLLNKSGVIIGKEWGGNGNLQVQGDATLVGKIGTAGWSPTDGLPNGFGGGVHTWDLIARGSVWCENYVFCLDARVKKRDLAENYYSDVELEAGDVVCLDRKEDLIVKSERANDELLLGVISTSPGLLLGGEHGEEDRRSDEKRTYPVALTGRVPCKVIDENGQIKRGDVLTSSSTPGYAMKATPLVVGGVEIYAPGTIIGKALEPFSAGTGIIEIFVTLK